MSPLRKALLEQAWKLASDPRVARVLADERVSRALVVAAGMPAKVQSFATEAVEKVVRTMDLAKEEEVQDLRRTVRALEDEVARLRRDVGSAGRGDSAAARRDERSAPPSDQGRSRSGGG
jgi:uncharacterized protein YlxW (UPF0749 family)